MKIVFGNEKRSWGGSQAMAAALARGLRVRGHEVVLFCRAHSALHERLAGEIPCEPVLAGFDASPFSLWRCAAALRRHRPDVVVTNTVKGPRQTGLAARLLKIPVVHREEMDKPYKRHWRYRLFYGSLPTRLIVNSQATRRTLATSVDWLSGERITVIPNGIDPAPYARAAPAALGLPASAYAVGFVGRFEPRKGVRELAAAWPTVAAALPEAHLVIAGHGEIEGELRATLAHAPRVHWLGFTANVASLMRALDVVAVPSHYEGFGLVAVEAMAAGVPVVATDASSLPEIVRDGVEGRLVPPRDPTALACALIELARDPAQRQRLGTAGQRRVRDQFTLDQMLIRHEALLREVAGVMEPSVTPTRALR